ncbi:PIG-L family deacetylase [Streptomyces bambusae]|uniref:PIG-L family deacetylase n=1 Tax=Streptomyces bambusae TaxID=1550616 RepID=A0ABS6Z415_9ACTN|nr:PIG-L family deacetylase [Streptomyces bambusae]MBW5482467.1 hypothetical protein [Streptomyces bambusae]
MGWATERSERAAARGRRRAGAAPAPRRSSLSRVLHLLAHPGDVLAATGSELYRAMAEPDRPVAVVLLTDGEPGDRDRLLRRLGRDGAWRRRTEELPDGTTLDVFALADAPRIEVCFTWSAEPPQPGAPPELVDRAAALLAHFAPGTVCTLDPDPEHTGWSPKGGAVRPDHPEHAAVAQAVLEAVARTAADGGRPVAVECFRPAGPCAAAQAPVPAVPRYPGRRIWLTRGTEGHLTAYAALGGRLARWTERTPGGPEWGERELLDTPPLLPVLSVAQAPLGWVHLVSLRRTPHASGGACVEVMHAVQYQSGRPLGEWRSLGNPNGTGPDKGREVGVPAVVVDAEGAAHVFARNFGRGVSSRSQRPDGSWTPWRDLKGSRVQDGLAALLDDEGRPELFAPSAGGVLRWRREGPGGDLREVPADRMPLLAAPGTALAALASGPGRITVYGCDARDRMLYACRTDGAATAVGTTGGAGVSVLRTAIDGYDCTVLLQRSPEGVTAVGAYPTEQEHAGLWWERTGGTGTREPAAAADAFGRLVVASLDGEGRLAVTRQDSTVPGLALGGWMTP